MSQISFPRKGYDGSNITQQELEKEYFDCIETRITKRLKKVYSESTDVREICATRYFIKNLQKIILAQPADLLSIHRYVLRHYMGVFDDRSPGSFNKRILDAFDYVGHRKSVLVDLAKWIDLKTCPYCNSHYTLYLGFKKDQKHPKGLTKFQFDHFLNKGDAPFLSMSLYNLIPSCAVCNSSKSDKDWPIELNPYESNINSLYRFRVFEPLRLMTREPIGHPVKIILKPTQPKYQQAIETLDNDVFLSKRYGRCQDVVQDIFDRAYTYPYYSKSPNFENMLSNFSEEKFKQIWLGTYTDAKDIEKRPFTKFAQDLWEQAMSQRGINAI